MAGKQAGGAVTENLSGRLYRFWSVLFLTPEGRPKSTLLLYSFCLSFVLLAIYGVAYYFLIDALEYALASSPTFVRNVAECLVPGIVGTAVCCLLYALPHKDRRVIPVSYLWLWLYGVLSLVVMAVLCRGDGEAFRLFLYLYALLVPVGLVSGTAAVFWLYLHRGRKS
ncbi:MAG: hypothetical protein LBR77_03420 [Lachnospiraceae bacterium]|jgi:hypothetical protein|nr:hypothetical protein [Lachnospiraceae bacterium]